MPNEIPQSDALAEASIDSLSELFSRDPEGLQKQDLARIVDELRAQRVRWAAVEAEKATKPAKATSRKASSLVTLAKAGDLGL